VCDGVAPFAAGHAGNEWQRNKPARHFVILCCGQSIEKTRAERTERPLRAKIMRLNIVNNKLSFNHNNTKENIIQQHDIFFYNSK